MAKNLSVSWYTLNHNLQSYANHKLHLLKTSTLSFLPPEVFKHSQRAVYVMSWQCFSECVGVNVLPGWLRYITLLLTTPVTSVRHFHEIPVSLENMFRCSDAIKHLIILISKFLKKKKNHQIQRVKHTYLTIVLELNYSYQSQNNIIKQCHYIVLGYNCSNYINKSSCRLYLW